MSKWYSVCTTCGLGGPNKPTKDCDHPVWTFAKEEDEKNGEETPRLD